MLVDPRKRPGVDRGVSSEQIARMEREIARLQMQVKSVEETYGIDFSASGFDPERLATMGSIVALIEQARN